jgi:hypothetical protein
MVEAASPEKKCASDAKNTARKRRRGSKKEKRKRRRRGRNQGTLTNFPADGKGMIDLLGFECSCRVCWR